MEKPNIDQQADGRTTIEDLIFVTMEGHEGGKVAIESNFGMVAFGDNNSGLIADIKEKVQQYFKTGFHGRILLREFKDTVIEI